MSVVVVPILAYQPSLAGIEVDLADTHFGELDWDLHLVAEAHEERVMMSPSRLEEEEPDGGDSGDGATWEPPLAFVSSALRADPAEIHAALIPILSVLHLFGSGSLPIREAWVYSGDRSQVENVVQLPVKSFDVGSEFRLRAETNEDDLVSAYDRVAKALRNQPSLEVTLEHLLLGLGRSDLSSGLLDLTIALESLVAADQEVAFKFSHLLSRVMSDRPQLLAEVQSLLKDLYDFRSRHVHGDRKKDYPRKRAALVGKWAQLEHIAKACVTYAIEYSAEKRPVAWRDHLSGLLLGTEERVGYDWGTLP